LAQPRSPASWRLQEPPADYPPRQRNRL